MSGPQQTLMITRAGRGSGAAVALLAAKAYALCINYRTNVESANRLVAQIRAEAASCPPTSMATAEALYVTGAISRFPADARPRLPNGGKRG